MQNQSSLIPIDGKPIRKKVVRELKSTLKKIDTAKQDIDVHFQESKPAFITWYESEMADLIGKVKTLDEKYRTKEWEIREVFAYAEFHQIPPAHAYLLIQERRNTPEEEREFDSFYDEEEPGYWETEEEEDNEKSSSHQDSFHSDPNSEDEFYEESHHRESSTDEKSESDSHRQKPRNQEEMTVLFRKIARFLHPDKNPDQTSEDKENWLTALKHYTEKNLSGLRDILTWIHIQKENSDSEVSIAEIQSLNKKFKKDLKAVQKQLRVYKKHPDWAFKKKTKSQKKAIRKELEEDLQAEFIRIHCEMEKLDRVLFSWKQYAKTSSHSPSGDRFFQY